MNKDKPAFVYLWMDSKNKMWYLGSHCGNKPTYTHSSSVMENFTMKTKPDYMKRRILAYGSGEDMVQLELNLIERYDLVQREDYYNLSNSFPFPSGPSHPSYIDGKSTTPGYYKEYRQRPRPKAKRRELDQRPERKKYRKEYSQKPEVIKYMKEYRQKPEVIKRSKEYMKEWRQRPEVKVRVKEYEQRPEVIERNKELKKLHRQKPEVKAKEKEYMKEWRQRPEVIERNKEYSLKYYSENKEKFREYYQKKRALNI